MVMAVIGITAGSGFATTGIRLVMIRMIDRALTLFPTISPTLFVDDLAAAVCVHLPSMPSSKWEDSSSTLLTLSRVPSRPYLPLNPT